MERSFVAIKPDGVQRNLVGDIISRFERKGFKVVGLKFIKVDRKLAESHYAEHEGRPFFESLINFITSGPTVAMVLEGKGVIEAARKMIGKTNPLESEPGTVRGDFGIDIGRNLIHGSDSQDSAQREINLWFNENELINWDPSLTSWIYE